MNFRYAAINVTLNADNKALTTDIFSVSNEPKYTHNFMKFIKTTTQEEADIYIASVFNPHFFIMLEITDIFEEFNTYIKAYHLYPY